MNVKSVIVILIVFSMLILLAPGMGAVHGSFSSYIGFEGGVIVYSPLNQTYSSQPLTLNVTLDLSEGLVCSITYTIDGKVSGQIPTTPGPQNPGSLFNSVSGSVQLPNLSAGSHRLTIYELAQTPSTYTGNQPFSRSYTDTLYFSISSSQNHIQTTPPTIDLSIQNETYTMPGIPLAFTVNQDVAKVAYSLDGEANVTITGDITLMGLSNEEHNITVYAWNDYGDVGGSSGTVNFAVAGVAPTATATPSVNSVTPILTSQAFPTLLVSVLVASIAIIIELTLVYLKNRARRPSA